MHSNRGLPANRAPPPRCVPLAEVREEDMSRAAGRYAGQPTPKKTAAQREADRKNALRIAECAEAWKLWERLDTQVPVPPTCPHNPASGFDDRIVELAKRGREICRKGVEVSPAASYAQWRSLSRLERKKHGEDCNLEPLHVEYYDAVRDYVARWNDTQTEVELEYQRVKAAGKSQVQVELAYRRSKAAGKAGVKKKGKGKGPKDKDKK